MNQHLQKILNYISQLTHLNEDEKTALLKSVKDADKDFEITSFKLDRTEKVKRTTAILLEETIEELELKRKAVEAQNKELEIESASERVRTVAMSMSKADDLLSICETMYHELKKSGFDDIRNAMIDVHYDDKNYLLNYDYSDEAGKTVTKFVYNSHPIVDNLIYHAKQSKEAFTEMIYSGKELDEWRVFRKQNGEANDARLDNAEALYYYFYSIGTGAIGISMFKAAEEEKLGILKRFRNVFDLAYKRYVDITNAEAQAREAKIEAALEKIRSCSLAMHRSDELKDVIAIMFEKSNELNVLLGTVAIWLFNKTTMDSDFWVGNNLQQPSLVHLPYNKELMLEESNYKDSWQAFINGESYINKRYSEDEKNRYFKYVFEHNDLTAIPAEARSYITQAKDYTASLLVEKNSSLYFDCWNGATYNDEGISILRRIAKVFEQAYVRFLDLQKAEAQAREAQIEAALERVRSRSMGMQKSEELQEVIKIVYDQFVHLKIKLDHTGFVVDYTPMSDWHFWIADEQDIPSKITHPYFDSVWANQFNEAKKNGLDFFATNLNFEEKNKFYNELLSYVPGLPEASKNFYLSAPGVAISTALFETVSLYIENFEGIPYSDEENKILLRFGKVFQQTYTRFLDLQKAEAQSREAQIQLALERVRARTMAMHQSSELAETASVLFQQIKELGFETWSCGFCVYTKNDIAELWMGADTGDLLPPMMIPYKEERTHRDIYEALQQKKQSHHKIWEGKDLEEHYTFLKTIPSVKIAIEQLNEAGLSLPKKQCYYVGFFKQGYLLLITKEPNEALEDLSKRFASVFDLTYTRFLDLQKAEAQARETRIEMALESVRAASLAMHHSNQLKTVATVMFKKLTELGLTLTGAFIFLFDTKTRDLQLWISTTTLSEASDITIPFTPEISNNSIFKDLWNVFENGEQIFNRVYSGKEKNDYFLHVGKYNTFPQEVKDLHQNAKSWITSIAPEKHAALGFDSWDEQLATAEDFQILKRFSKAFEQAYVRFLDLQKAETQAKEAQIEAALESVRSSSLAMHKSDQLKSVAAVMFKKWMEFGLSLTGAFIFLYDKETRNLQAWIATTALADPIEINTPYSLVIAKNQIFKDEWSVFETGKEIFNRKYSGKIKNDFFRYIGAYNNYPQEVKDFQLKAESWIISIAGEKHCAVGFDSWSGQLATTEDYKILKRFARTFEQAYIRFLDLQKAEAQARESQIEAALERVRSRTLAMQKSGELAETSAVLFRQLIGLGIEPHRLYISIMKDDDGESEFWITDENGSKVSAAYADNLNANASFKKMYEGWKEGRSSLIIDMQGKELEDYFQHLNSLGVPFKYGLKQKRRIQHLAYFNRGFIGMAAPDDQPRETIHLLKRFAAVFNLTFTRFNDLKIAEAHAVQAEHDLIEIKAARKKAEETLNELQVTQNQLVQKEKMASLGELTAGIAHEIQNPLNFVNNFSEVSKELLIEMREAMENGDKDVAEEIANDIIQNLEKINHHGKRADAIVKGMLQHSRQTSGTKEPTDINALCDEYLRLSYHGLRAKDKSFNADFKTDFDSSIGKINIVPQDLGRVLLNLFNNAFYAVNEKSKQSTVDSPQLSANYKPLVSIQTKKVDNEIEIRVTDNGNGIPQSIIDKIFQPFFTTKPTGQGTGLGLSLAYDIITKEHNGTIKVESKEGEGSEFVIQLPVQS